MLRRLLVLLLLLVLSACATVESAPAVGEPQISEAAVPRLSLEDARAAFDSGNAVFVDARPLSSYEQEHISGAISIPLDELEARLGELDPAQWIITYCT